MLMRRPPREKSFQRGGRVGDWRRGDAMVRAHVATDHEARRAGVHDVDGKIVDGGAVHQHVIAAKHGRDHAGDGDCGAQCPPYRAFAMLDRARRIEIGAQAEERRTQVLDEHIAILAFEEPRYFAAARERDQRERVVVHRIAVDETAAVA